LRVPCPHSPWCSVFARVLLSLPMVMSPLIDAQPMEDINQKLGMKTLLQSRPWKSLKGAYGPRGSMLKTKARRPAEEPKPDNDIEISVPEDVRRTDAPTQKPAVPVTVEPGLVPDALPADEAADLKDGSPTSHLQWLLPLQTDAALWESCKDGRASKPGGLSREMLRARGHKSLEDMRKGKNFDRFSLQALGESVLSGAVQRAKQTENSKASEDGESSSKPEPCYELPLDSSLGPRQPPGVWGSYLSTTTSSNASPVYVRQDASCRVPQGFHMPSVCQQESYPGNLNLCIPVLHTEACNPFPFNSSTDSPRFVDCKDDALYCPAISGVPMKIDVSSLVSVKVMV